MFGFLRELHQDCRFFWGVAPRGIEQVIYFARYLVVDVKEVERKEGVKPRKGEGRPRKRDFRNI